MSTNRAAEGGLILPARIAYKEMRGLIPTEEEMMS
jgi:hypothetical protein